MLKGELIMRNCGYDFWENEDCRAESCGAETREDTGMGTVAAAETEETAGTERRAVAEMEEVAAEETEEAAVAEIAEAAGDMAGDTEPAAAGDRRVREALRDAGS